MRHFDTRLTLYKFNEKLMVVDHASRIGVEIEIDCCKSRIRKGEATHYEIEALSPHGAEYVNELRAR